MGKNFMQLYRIILSIFFIVPAAGLRAGKVNLPLLYRNVDERKAQEERFMLITEPENLKKLKDEEMIKLLIKELNAECESTKRDYKLLSYCKEEVRLKDVQFGMNFSICKLKIEEHLRKIEEQDEINTVLDREAEGEEVFDERD